MIISRKKFNHFVSVEKNKNVIEGFSMCLRYMRATNNKATLEDIDRFIKEEKR